MTTKTPRSPKTTNGTPGKGFSEEQRTELLQMMAELLQAIAGKEKGQQLRSKGTDNQIRVWEDDPFLEAAGTGAPTVADTITVDIPTNEHPNLATAILGPKPDPALYDPATQTTEFLYWNAASALARGVNFWGPLLPEGTVWSTTNPTLQVNLDDGVDLNAFYGRDFGLVFFHDDVAGETIYSVESSDIVCHELGHALLDALKPELFAAFSLEVDAFHEAFGDISGMLSALQLPTMRTYVLEQTGGDLALNSRLAQMARELGWAIRQFAVDAVDNDCLRNAANSFTYQDPNTLPFNAPANQLSGQAHSFSRVFSGAFLDVLAAMYEQGPARKAADAAESLALVTQDAGQLLVEAIRVASVGSGYYSQVAAGMIQADQSLNNGAYRAALVSSFVRRGILSADSGVALVRELQGSRGTSFGITGVNQKSLQFDGDNQGYKKSGGDLPTLPLRPVALSFGATIYVHMPSEPKRFGVTAATVGGGGAASTSREAEARSYVQGLVQRGKIATEGAAGVLPTELIPPGTPYPSDHTHELVKMADGKAVLKRRHFDCGLCRARRLSCAR